MIKKVRFWGSALLLIVGMVAAWNFFAPWDRKIAEKRAVAELDQYAKDFQLNREALGKPVYVSGNDRDGYLFYWDIHLEDGEKAGSLIISVTRQTRDVTGVTPLDCRPGLDQMTRAKGLGHLCDNSPRSPY